MVTPRDGKTTTTLPNQVHVTPSLSRLGSVRAVEIEADLVRVHQKLLDLLRVLATLQPGEVQIGLGIEGRWMAIGERPATSAERALIDGSRAVKKPPSTPSRTARRLGGHPQEVGGRET